MYPKGILAYDKVHENNRKQLHSQKSLTSVQQKVAVCSPVLDKLQLENSMYGSRDDEYLEINLDMFS